MTESSDEVWTPEQLARLEEDLAFGESLDEAWDTGYDRGFKDGYDRATIESYPELSNEL